MRSYTLLVLLAGCGFHVHGAGVTGGDAPPGGDDAPAGGDAPPAIDGAPAADAPPDSPTDSDGDGVPDALDNCPNAANADQRDHDVDGRGDVCDLCPHITEAVDVDSDGDGIGDACDPRPTMAGDTRLLWVGFYDANDIAGWNSNVSTFSVSNGHLTGGATNVGLSYIYEPTSWTHAYAETLVHFNTLANASGMTQPAAVLYTGDSGQFQYYQCELAVTQNGNQVTGLDVYPINQNHFDQSAWSGTISNGADFMLHAGVFGTSHECRATQGATTTAQVMQGAGANTGVVVLGTADANVSFDYLFVVGMPN